MLQVSVVLLGVLITIVAGSRRPAELCEGTDVSKDPRLEARQVDGTWHTQAMLTTGVASNSIFFFQDQARAEWILDWDAATQNCTYRKFEDTQVQSATLGPFVPCFSARSLLPDEASTPSADFLFWMPNRRLLMFYRCPVQPRPDNICPEQPIARVITRTLDFSPRDREIVRRKLKSLGVSLGSFTMFNARENRCRLPPLSSTQAFGLGGGFGG